MSASADALLSFLSRTPELSYCEACLAKTNGMIVPEVLRAWAELLMGGRTCVGQGPCVTCLQVRTVISAKTSDAIEPSR